MRIALAALASVLLASAACSGGGASGDSSADGAAKGPDAASQTSGANCSDAMADAINCATLAPGVLATGRHSPRGLAVDAKYVYWVDGESSSSGSASNDPVKIVKCAKTGCNNSPVTIAAGAWSQVTNLATDGTNVYWGASGKIFKCSAESCGSPEVLWSSSSGAEEIVVADAGLYFDFPDADQARACSIDGCDGGTPLLVGSADTFNAPTTSSGGTVVALAADGTAVYILETFEGPALDTRLVACAPENCSATGRVILLEGLPPIGSLLAVDSANLYFALSVSAFFLGPPRPGPFGATDDDAGALSTISSIDKSFDGAAGTDAGSLSTLIDDVEFPSAIASDGQTVYFAQWGSRGDAAARPSGSGKIAKCAVTGCEQRATVIQDYINYPQAIAVDATNVYWTDFGSGTNASGSDDGRVMFRAK